MAKIQTTLPSVSLSVLLTLTSCAAISIMPRYSNPAPVNNGAPIFINGDGLDSYDSSDYHVISAGLPMAPMGQQPAAQTGSRIIIGDGFDSSDNLIVLGGAGGVGSVGSHSSGGLARNVRFITELDYPVRSRSSRGFRSRAPRRLSSPLGVRLSRPYSRNGKPVSRISFY